MPSNDEKYVGVRKMSRLIRRILKSDRDCAIAITGIEGEGKSTLAMLLSIFMDKRFDFERNVIFMPTEAEVRQKIFTLRKYTPIVLDEAMRVLYKREWQSRARKQLNILFSLCRKRNLAFFMCIPKLWDLDTYMRDHRIKIWIFVPVRGIAMVFLKDESPFTNDVWNREKNQKLIERYMSHKSLSDRRHLIETLKRIPNYAYSFTFPDLPPELKERYVELNTLHFKDKELDTHEVEKETARLKRARLAEMVAIGYLKYKLNMTVPNIVKELGLKNESHIRNILSEFRKLKGIKSREEKMGELNLDTANRILNQENEL